MYLDLLLLSVIICFIVDVSGALKKFKPPLGCSLCMTWWIGLIYLIITRNLSIMGIAYVAFLSLNSQNITGVLIWVRETLTWIIRKISLF